MLSERPAYERRAVVPIEGEIIYKDSTYNCSLEWMVSAGVLKNSSDANGYLRVSSFHGRSIYQSQNILERDIFGNVFTARSIKGAIFDELLHPSVPDANDPSEALLGLWAKGLIESDNRNDVTRWINSAHTMRELGLISDWPLAVMRVDRVSKDGQMVSVHGLLMDHHELRANWLKTHPTFKDANTKVLNLVIDEHKRKMQNSQIYLIQRNLPVAERLCDLAIASSLDELEVKLNSARIWCEVSGVRMPDTSTVSGLKEYFTNWLPIRQAQYLSRVHKCQLTYGRASYDQNSAHDQNWMTIGALCDPDSVMGIPLNDHKPSRTEKAADIDKTVTALHTLASSEIVRFVAPEALETVEETFVEAYVNS